MVRYTFDITSTTKPQSPDPMEGLLNNLDRMVNEGRMDLARIVAQAFAGVNETDDEWLLIELFDKIMEETDIDRISRFLYQFNTFFHCYVEDREMRKEMIRAFLDDAEDLLDGRDDARHVMSLVRSNITVCMPA